MKTGWWFSVTAARSRSRTCQPLPLERIARRILCLGFAVKGFLQNLRLYTAECMGLAGLQIVEDDLGRAEEHRVDLVKVLSVSIEDRRKRGTVIWRSRRGNLRANLQQRPFVGVNPEVDPAAVENCIVGPTDRFQIAHRAGGQRRRTKAGNNLRQVELEFVQFVKRRFQRAPDDLQAPGYAECR